VSIESAAKEFIAKEVVLENSIDLDTNQLAIDRSCILVRDRGWLILRPISEHGLYVRRPEPRTAAPVRSATMIPRPNQIKAVLEDEQDACAIEISCRYCCSNSINKHTPISSVLRNSVQALSDPKRLLPSLLNETVKWNCARSVDRRCPNF
jgi:hypothetical protein